MARQLKKLLKEWLVLVCSKSYGAVYAGHEMMMSCWSPGVLLDVNTIQKRKLNAGN